MERVRKRNNTIDTTRCERRRPKQTESVRGWHKHTSDRRSKRLDTTFEHYIMLLPLCSLQWSMAYSVCVCGSNTAGGIRDDSGRHCDVNEIECGSTWEWNGMANQWTNKRTNEKKIEEKREKKTKWTLHYVWIDWRQSRVDLRPFSCRFCINNTIKPTSKQTKSGANKACDMIVFFCFFLLVCWLVAKCATNVCMMWAAKGRPTVDHVAIPSTFNHML